MNLGHQSPYVCMRGDFNANLLHTSRFEKELRKICSDNSLIILADLMLPADTFTFVSVCHGSTS